MTANDDWHFNVDHASAADLEDFKIEEMAATMKELAPDLWILLQILLSRDEIDVDGDQVMDDLSDANEFDESGEFASIGKNAKEKRRGGIQNVKVLPDPVAAMDTTSRSRLRIARTTWICHRQGL